MPLYYFDVKGHDELPADPDGDDFPDLREATVAAVALLHKVAPWNLPDGLAGVVSVTVRNEQREAILRASLHLRVEYFLEKEPEQTARLLPP